jgi:gag-polyprotein putative aspartyl protease
MSTHSFNRKRGPILVEAEATGPTGSTSLKLLLDTGATTSLIKLVLLLQLGFDPTQPIRRMRMTTGSAVGTVPVFALTRLSAFGQHRYVFPVIGHALPASSGVDGLLGLDFLRDQVLTIDFRLGQIALA